MKFEKLKIQLKLIVKARKGEQTPSVPTTEFNIVICKARHRRDGDKLHKKRLLIHYITFSLRKIALC